MVRSSEVGVVRRCRRACSSSSSSPSPRHLAQGGPEAGRAVAGEADQAGLLVEGPADGLADPEGGVGGELEALAPVELVDGVLEAEVALLDEVEQLHARGQGVAAGDAHDEAQVGPDEAVLGRGGAAGPHGAAPRPRSPFSRATAASRPFSMIWESSRSSSAVSSGTRPISLRYWPTESLMTLRSPSGVVPVRAPVRCSCSRTHRAPWAARDGGGNDSDVTAEGVRDVPRPAGDFGHRGCRGDAAAGGAATSRVGCPRRTWGFSDPAGRGR